MQYVCIFGEEIFSCEPLAEYIKEEQTHVSTRTLSQIFLSGDLMEYDAFILFCESEQLPLRRYVRMLHMSSPNTLLLLAAPRPSQNDLCELFQSGADDYMEHPASYAILKKRLQAGLRRMKKSEELFCYHDLLLDHTHDRLFIKEASIRLNHKEALLLRCLMQQKERYVSRQKLLCTLAEHTKEDSGTMLDALLSSLRAHLKNSSSSIHFQASLGYCLCDAKHSSDL